MADYSFRTTPSTAVTEATIPPPSDSAAQEAAKNGKAAAQEVVNKNAVVREASMQIAEKTQKQSEAGAFWNQLVENPEQALTSQLDSLFPEDGDAKNLAVNMIHGLVSGQLDPESPLAAYSNSLTPTAYSGPTTVAGTATGTPLFSKNLSASGKVVDGPTDCARSMIVGTVSSVGRMTTGSASKNLRSVATVHQTVASLASLYKEFKSMLMTMPVSTMTTLLADKKALLNQISSQVKICLSTVESLTADDYGLDHINIIKKALAELQTADSDLNDVERVLLAGGGFQEPAWNRAEGNIQDAADILRKTDPDEIDVAGAKQLTIIGYLSSINTSLQVLLCRQSLLEKIYANLSVFPASFDAFGKFDNLFGPVIDQIQCLLKMIMSDMSATINGGVAFTYFLKEKEWFVELQALLAFMSQTKNLLNTVDTGEAGASLSEEFSVKAPEFNNPNDFSVLAGMIETYSALLRETLTQPQVNLIGIRALAAAIEDEIAHQLTIVDTLEQALMSFLGSFGPTLTQALQVASGIENFLKDKDLQGMLDALKDGDIKAFFSATGERKSKKEELLDNLATLIEWARINMPGEVDNLTQIYDDLRAQLRSEALYKELADSAAENYIREQKETEAPKDNLLLRTMNRIEQRMSGVQKTMRATDEYVSQIQNRINAVLGKAQAVQAKVVGTLTRISQGNPVSCASR